MAVHIAGFAQAQTALAPSLPQANGKRKGLRPGPRRTRHSLAPLLGGQPARRRTMGDTAAPAGTAAASAWLDLPGPVPTACILRHCDSVDVKSMRAACRAWNASLTACILRLTPRQGFPVRRPGTGFERARGRPRRCGPGLRSPTPGRARRAGRRAGGALPPGAGAGLPPPEPAGRGRPGRARGPALPAQPGAARQLPHRGR